MPKRLDDFATPFAKWLKDTTALGVSTRHGYVSYLRWLVERMETAEPTEDQLREAFQYIAENEDFRYTQTRRVWTLYTEYRKQADRADLPDAHYKLKGKALVPHLPRRVSTVVRRMVKDLDIPAERLYQMTWKDVQWENEFSRDDTYDGINVHVRDYKGVLHPCPVKWLKALQEWAQPGALTDPLIPFHPGSELPYPAKGYTRDQ